MTGVTRMTGMSVSTVPLCGMRVSRPPLSSIPLTKTNRSRYRSFTTLGKSGCSPDLADLRRTIPVPLSTIIVRLSLK